MTVDLTSLRFSEMESLFAGIRTRSGNATHRAETVFRGMYRDLATRLEQIEPLARDFREQLEAQAFIGRLHPAEVLESEDGTCKFVFELHDGSRIESVWIPTRWGNTLCISSQAGCAMGCSFCHTGTMGLVRNLTVAEIVGQVVAVAAEREVTGIVFMGMGEPLHNYRAVTGALEILLHNAGFAFSHNRVTVSTVGLVEEIVRLGNELPVNLCVSIHSPFEEVRAELVPANKRWPLAEVIAACRSYPEPVRRRMMFAYTLLPGVNDRDKDAAELAGLLEGLPQKLNLIPFNPFPGTTYRRPTDAEVEAFQQRLVAHGFRALYRTTRGDDIMGACGQLATTGRRR